MRIGRYLLAVFLASATGPVFAQGVAVQWNFNNSNTTASVNNTGGTPTTAALGGITTDFAAGGGNDGSNDPAATNNAWQTTGYPAQAAGNLTGGVRFNMPTTGYSDLIARLDLRHSNTSSNFFRIEYTTDGTNWTSTGTTAAYGFERFYTYTVDLTGVAAANNNPTFGLRVLT